jgi:hypothetical protein
VYTGQREEAVANRVLFIHHHQPKLKLQRLQRPAERRTASVVYLGGCVRRRSDVVVITWVEVYTWCRRGGRVYGGDELRVYECMAVGRFMCLLLFEFFYERCMYLLVR